MSALINTLNQKVITAQEQAIHSSNQAFVKAKNKDKEEQNKALHDSPNVIQEITEKMLVEAEKGNKNLRFYIVDDGINSALSTYQQFLQEEIIQHFTKEGMKVHKNSYTLYPSGSDDYYGCKVYSWWIDISW